jgi:hypothetical protein
VPHREGQLEEEGLPSGLSTPHEFD